MMRRVVVIVVMMVALWAGQGYAETERDRAMKEAMFQAEYMEQLVQRESERTRRLREPMRGKRERAIIKQYEAREIAGERPVAGDTRDFRAAKPVAKQAAIGRLKKKPAPGFELVTNTIKDINSKIHPVKISGDYKLSWGYDWGDTNNEGRRGIWKNADWNKANQLYVLDNQYVFGRDRENTYDKRVFDKFRLKVETVKEKGFNFLSEMVVDPWSFVGKTDYFMMNSEGGSFPLRLRYWSNTQSTLDERIWLTSGTDFIDVPEIKVEDGRTNRTFLTSRWGEVDFEIPELDINRNFRPLRKLEANYNDDNFEIKAFPLADPDHAYTTDDPLELSNHHIYWEPSPWLNRWKPALYFPSTGDFRRGKWANDISFEARDSDFNYLTLLRGLSFEVRRDDMYIKASTSSPMHPWQAYDRINSIPGAVRYRQELFDNYYVGAIYTYNYGFDQQKIDAYNHVVGWDAGYEIDDFLNVRGEFAMSMDRTDWKGHDSSITDTKTDSSAFKVEAEGEFVKTESEGPMFKVHTAFTHMGDEFRPRLSSYRNTRSDQFWGKHLSFETVKEDFNQYRIGDGVDIGRDAYSIRIENALFGDFFKSLFDMRFVNEEYDSKIENVYREELTLKPLSNLALKFLYRYQDIPKTRAGIDPFIITDDISEDNTDEYVINTDIRGEEDADVWTWSLGFHYDPVNWLGLEGIYEKTNDYDTYPQRVFNDASFRDLGGVRDLSYFLYGQALVAIPPYDDYDIYKARIFYEPVPGVRTKLEYVVNTFKHATGRDDNISHYGVEVDMDITEKLMASFKFTRSQLVDYFMQEQRNKDVPFNTHTNLFAQVKYDIDTNNTFVVQFGEFFVPKEQTPIPWILNTVDTQHIMRFFLQGKF